MIKLLEIKENSKELEKLTSWERKVLLSQSKKGKITAFTYTENKFCFIANYIAIKDVFYVFIFDEMIQEEADKLKIALGEIFPENKVFLNLNTIKCNLSYFKDTTIESERYLKTIRYDTISQFETKFLQTIQKFETKNQGLKVVYNDELKEFENGIIGFITNHLGKNIYKITSCFDSKRKIWKIKSVQDNQIAFCKFDLQHNYFFIQTNDEFTNHGFATLLRAFSYYEHIRDGRIINYSVDKYNFASVKLMNFFSTENDLDCIKLDIEKIRSQCYISRNKELPSNNLKIETPLDQEETKNLLCNTNDRSPSMIN